MSRPLAKIRDRLRGRENDIPLSLPILQGRWKSTYPHLCRFYKDGGNGNPLISADSTRTVETATHSSLPILQGWWKRQHTHLCRSHKDGGNRHTSIFADSTRTVENDIPPSLPILQGRWKSTYPHLCRFYKDGGNQHTPISGDSTGTVETATNSSLPILQGRWNQPKLPFQPRRGCVIWPMVTESASADSVTMGCISSRSRRPRRRSRISMTAYNPLSLTIKEEGAPRGAPSVNH